MNRYRLLSLNGISWLSLYSASLFTVHLASLAVYLGRSPSDIDAWALVTLLLVPLGEIIVFHCIGRLLMAPGTLRDNWCERCSMH